MVPLTKTLPLTNRLPVRCNSEEAVKYNKLADPLMPLWPGTADPE